MIMKSIDKFYSNLTKLSPTTLWTKIKYPKPISISQIMKYCFHSWKQYAVRLEYNLHDYQNHQIPMKFQTFRRTIIITIAAIINISFLIILVIDPNLIGLPISLQNLNEILHIQECRLLAEFAICNLLLLEHMCFIVFKRTLCYECHVNYIFIKYFNYNDSNLFRYFHQQYSRFILIINLFTNMIYKILTFGLTIIFIMIIFFTIKSFINGHYYLQNIILFICIAIFVFIHTSYTFGQLFISMKHLMFSIEFFCLQFKQLLYHLNNILKRNQRRQSQKPQPQQIKHSNIMFIDCLFWYYFHRPYLQLYNETLHLNYSLRSIFLSIELISKCSIIFCSLFYGRQIQMNLFNSLFILLLLSAFGSSTVIYSLVSSFPQLNQLCCSWLSNYNAQRQYYLLQRKQQQQQLITGNSLILNTNNNRRTIRLNLFIQTLSTNQFGLTCDK
ncbi:uncharacterized protein LOC142645816 isoform X2 [Dermatophagoides pteronyssinus]|uniref:uncharacterized protein LOC142645816 isoform X2 n=1 Tax=Dermatophagoides pteronyssinus TaxID=6956 RepID=UPI003F679E80